MKWERQDLTGGRMQLDQNTLLIIGAIVVLVLFVVIIANARRRRPPPTLAERASARAADDGSAEVRLSRLADLRSKGLVTEEEYETQRRKILGEL
jgi:uncharacterized membrane protein